MTSCFSFSFLLRFRIILLVYCNSAMDGNFFLSQSTLSIISFFWQFLIT